MGRRLISKIIRLICTRKFVNKRIRVFKPCMYYVHPYANVKIDKYLNFNRQWDDARTLRNKMLGSLYVSPNATLTVDAFDVYAGSRITINPGAKLALGSGYMNHDCVIDCFESITIGHNVVISERVVIRDSDNHVITAKLTRGGGG